MHRLLTLLIVLVLPSSAWAASCVECGTRAGVVGAVTRYRASGVSPVRCCQATTLRLCNPDLSAVGGVPQRYWKCVDGPDPDSDYDSVVEMSQAEKDAIDDFLEPPDAFLEVESPSGIIGGIQARDSDGTVRVGSRTPNNVAIAYNNTNVVWIGTGGRVAMGNSIDPNSVDARPQLTLERGNIQFTPVSDNFPCNESRRGQFVFQEQGQNNPDRIVACMKRGNNTYAWQVIIEAP